MNAMESNFDFDGYERCSNNNMPMITEFQPLSQEEQAEVDAALEIND